MARVRVELNPAGMAELLKSAGVEADLQRRGSSVLAAARAGAPVDEGDYQRSLHVETVITDRATVRVRSGTDHGYLVEATTGNLARALDAAGGT